MKNSLLLALALLAFADSLNGQNVAQNSRLTNITDQKITFRFDIQKLNKKYLFQVKMVTADHPEIVPKTIDCRGDCQKLLAGNDLEITWNFAADGFRPDQIKTLDIQPFAENSWIVVKDNRKWLVATVEVAVAAAGGFLVYEGGRQERQAKTDYDLYLKKNFPTGASWLPFQSTRGAEYEAANDRQKRADWLKIGGWALVGTAVTVFAIDRFSIAKQKRKDRRETRLGLLPDLPQLLLSANGIGLRWQF